MDIIPRNLQTEMGKDSIVIAAIKDRGRAEEFYQALCNVTWIAKDELPEDEEIINRLKGIAPQEWSCSWRYAGGIIAHIRDDNYGFQENYMDFYCTGGEGCVSDFVREIFKRMGWVPHPDHDDNS